MRKTILCFIAADMITDLVVFRGNGGFWFNLHKLYEKLTGTVNFMVFIEKDVDFIE